MKKLLNRLKNYHNCFDHLKPYDKDKKPIMFQNEVECAICSKRIPLVVKTETKIQKIVGN